VSQRRVARCSRAGHRSLLLALAGVVAALSGEAAPAAPNNKPKGIAARRTAWLYNKGSLKKLSSGQWLEVNTNGKSQFREIARNDNYVGLFDPTRKVHVRLYNRSMYWWSAEKRKWNFRYNGRWQDPRKRPLNPDRFPDERGRLSTPVERKAFPHLGHEYEVLGPATKVYNCIAWSIGITNRWVWPARPGQPATVRDFDELYGRYGYRRVKGLNFDKAVGSDKLVLYVKRKPDGTIEPTHGARQLSDGSWSSKLGQLPLIRHLDPDDLDGASYGVPFAVYVRSQTRKK
jgi:hypothetical protein